ncbi:alpha/beta hydrolase [Sinomonas halotolerans]|uniref:Alpha/beta hydrolase n=1 Tax=Sinomonas halotolerans TaxID=1644133 RepID=A0ABU9X1V1_9MICC
MPRRFGERRVAEGATELWVYSGGDGPREFALVHGIGVSAVYYRRLAGALAVHGRVHLVELPGFGKAREPRRPLTMEEFAEAAWSALDALGVREPLLIGHSMGAQVVVEMAIQRPGTRSIALLAPTVNAAERTVPLQALRLAQDAALEPPGVKPIVLWDYARCGVSWWVATLREMMRHRIEERLPLVEASVLIVGGRRDPICPIPWLRRLASLSSRARLVIVPREAHVMMYRGARSVAAELLAEAPSGAGTP